MLKPILFAAATFAAAFSFSPAVASTADPGVRTVSYADLDLNSAAGRARLERRIADAVREVCGAAPSFDLARRRAVRHCRTDTRANVRVPAAAGLFGTR